MPFMASAAQRTDVVLVQGLSESAADMSYWGSVLNGTGNYTTHTVGTINSSGFIGTQVAALSAFLSDNGFGAAAVVAGHSQGGLVSRIASRSGALGGLLTVATPNEGAPIADAGLVLIDYNALIALYTWDANMVFTDDLSAYPWYPNYLEATAIVADVLPFVVAAFDAGGVWFWLNNPYIGDLSPYSSVIGDLQTNWSLEQASQREAIAVDVVDYGAAPWRLLYSDASAQSLANAIFTYGVTLNLDGVVISLGVDPADPINGSIQEFASGITGIGNIAIAIPEIANIDLVGGVPNDGLVPTANERLPDKIAFRTVTDRSHNDILSDGQDIVDAMNHLTGR